MRIDEKLIEEFLMFYKNNGLKEKTLYRFRYDFMAFYRWLEKNKSCEIEAVDKLTIEEYKRFLFSLWPSKYSRYKNLKWLSSVTISQKVEVIRNFLAFTNYVYDIGLDPSKVKLPKSKSERMDFFTEEEIKKILEAVEKTEKYRINQLRLKLLILVCYVSWLRLDEIRQITIEDIENLKVKINWKGDKKRYVFFTNECKKILDEYLEEQKKPLPRIWKIARNRQDKHYAIIGHHYQNFGTKICKQTIQTAFSRLNNFLNRSKHITCHTLRHSFATTLLRKWANISDIQNLMGHAKLSTTAIYLHEDWGNLYNVQQKTFSSFCI